MKTKRMISGFLALMFVLGALASTLPVSVSATTYSDRVDENGKPLINYLTQVYNSPEEKLAEMTEYKTQNGYTIYVEEYTGEVAFQDVETKEVIFSNPYDIGKATNLVSGSYAGTSNTVKEKLLSQIFLTYKEKQNETEKTMYSYTEASKRGQITVKNIKNGVRMEYALGEILITRLVPRRLSKERFETMILAHITNDHDLERLKSFYKLYDSSDPSITETEAKEIEAKFPITRRMPIYVCSTDIKSNELKELERIIKAYCAEFYTLDDMEQDHADTDYYGIDVAPPCFRMALEYTIDENGLNVRLPANGIRFDESTYQLGRVSVLPLMGAGNLKNEGYTFIPDGSGAIINYEDVGSGSDTIAGTVYGTDYSYITIAGSQFHHEETMRYPVFGNVVQDEDSGDKSGFVAFVTEGDSMAEIVSQNEGNIHNYSFVYARFTPRPTDTYRLSDTVEGAGQGVFSVTSDRKYSGSYVIKYRLLSDKKKAGADTYEPSYVGMAKAYRDYLVGENILTKKTDSGSDIPLYLETFGAIETTSTFLTFPVSVDKELTTFEDVTKIYDELSEDGIKNINFKLTGFANGGLDSTYPAKVKWVSALGGSKGMAKLKDYAAEKGFGLYPDFDFAYVAVEGLFDGFSAKSDAVKTIDSRYTSRKYYDSASQSLENDYAKAVSTSRYEYFGEKFKESYSEYGLDSVSVSTLGTTLNSDFDKKDPYNREDSKKYTTELLDTLKEEYGSVMTEGGNAYAYPYTDHILGVSTDSSNYVSASRSVPFVGFVLHGFVDFAGEPLNMEGDIDYALLKALENGASIYFTVAYENANELKESETYNKYYSVSFENWKDEIESNYEKLNGALSDLQTKLLDSHEFIDGFRVPTDSELDADKAELEAAKEKNEKDAAEKAAREEQKRQIAERMGVAYTPPKDSGSSKITDNTKTADDGTVYNESKKYTTAGGTIVKETYDDGTTIYINYNSFDVVVKAGGKTVKIDALGFIKE